MSLENLHIQPWFRLKGYIASFLGKPYQLSVLHQRSSLELQMSKPPCDHDAPDRILIGLKKDILYEQKSEISSFKKNTKGSKRFQKVPKGSKRFQKVPKGSKRFQKVPMFPKVLSLSLVNVQGLLQRLD